MSAARPLPVLVAGDANLDLVLTGDVRPRFGQVEQLIDAGDLVLGGSACITACGLARLEVPTRLVSRLGADPFGALTREGIRAHGVDDEEVVVDARTPTGLSVILAAAEDRAILTVPGTIPGLRAEQVLHALERGSAAPGIVHTGSFYLQPEIMRGLPEVYSRAQADGWTTSLDTNWDPSETWGDLRDLLPHLDVLLPNRNELRAIAGALGEDEAAQDVELGRRIARRGPRVVVKDGADGGWSITADGPLTRAPGLPVAAVDTTGAGDSFNAGYLAALAHGVADEQSRLRWATTGGSLSTVGAGGTGRQATLAQLLEAVPG